MVLHFQVFKTRCPALPRGGLAGALRGLKLTLWIRLAARVGPPRHGHVAGRVSPGRGGALRRRGGLLPLWPLPRPVVKLRPPVRPRQVGPGLLGQYVVGVGHEAGRGLR